MALKVEKFDGSPERAVVVACLVNKDVLAQVVPLWTTTALPSKWANLVVGWAVDYYKEWKRAPGRDVQTQFDMWRPTAGDPATVELVGGFLQTVSDQYRQMKEGINPEFTLKVATELMHRVRLVETKDRIAAYLEAGDLTKASAEFQKYRPVELGSNAWLDLGDLPALEALVARTRADRAKPLIEYDGALGAFFERAFERDSFVAFLGGKKGAKSFWLQSLAWKAFEQGRKVAYFDAGDMSKGQIVVDRLTALAAERPIEGNPRHPFSIPTHIDPPAGGKERTRPTIEHEEVWHKKRMTDVEVVAAVSKLSITGPGSFRLSPHANSTLSVPGAEAVLEQWERDSWSPDVCFFDYADIMAPIDRRLEGLDRINETWKALRALSQKRNCLVVTATQARRDSSGKWLMEQEDVADETRKLAHPSAFYAINRNAPDEAAGTCRINCIAGRNTPMSKKEFVWVAGNLSFANPAMVSTFC